MKTVCIRKGRKLRPLNPERRRWTLCYRIVARKGEGSCHAQYLLTATIPADACVRFK